MPGAGGGGLDCVQIEPLARRRGDLAIMLAIWNFGLVPAINIPWLFQLTIDTFGSARYLESLITAAATHALLFGSLMVGARVSLPRRTMVSIAS
jgi:hypothetical protein